MPDLPDAGSGFPIMLDLVDQRVLVVGGGEAAAAKCRLLAASGACIAVVDAAPEHEVVELAQSGAIALERRDVRDSDFDDVRLCYVALDDAAAASAVVAFARVRRVLVNAVDRPVLCDFATPAIVRRGPITIAIATGAAAPALARNLRARIEAAVPGEFGRLAAFCGAWRTRVAAALTDRLRRRRFWDQVLDGEAAGAVLRGDTAAATDAMQAALVAAAAGRAGRQLGKATLVGAGPGDVGLLTLAAVRALQQADVILFDKLIGPGVLELARRDAARVDVGKRCGRHAMSQAAISALLLRHVREGRHVVRLKGGDPLVFGRGGEELQALRDAGCGVEVIPGVTAALAAAAAMGIPLTHRGVAQSLHFITAHASDGKLPPHNWTALVQAGGTLAIYMGARTLGVAAAALMAAGLPAATPCVAVSNASLPQERRLFASIAEIGRLVADAGAEIGSGGPTLVLVGDVVAIAAQSAAIAASTRAA